MPNIQVTDIRIHSGGMTAVYSGHAYMLDARLVDTESENAWGYSWDKGISVADDDLESGFIRLGNAITIAICSR